MSKSKVNLYRMPELAKQEERIENALKLIGLEGIRSSFVAIAEKVIQNCETPHDFLEALLEKEILWREENRLNRWILQARFPWRKTLDDFDFSFQPSLDRLQIHELASCRFIDRTNNVVFFGPPGVGKTHLAIAIGLEAIYLGYEVRFFTLRRLIELTDKIVGNGEEIHRLLTTLLRPKLLILDEMDLHEISQAASTFLFKLLNDRYEKGSVVFTSNRTFMEWERLFGNQARAGAIIDRITHHCIIINIQGDSYRIKDKLKKLAR